MSGSSPAPELPDLEIIRPLGHGQAADVFLAREPDLQRMVAVKVLRPTGGMDDIARLRFAREGRALAALTHPGVVQLHRTGETPDGRPFLVMQYVQGRSLEERLAAEGPLGVPEARRVLGAIAEALAAAHRHGIVHRDLRPSNVLIEDETGRVLLTDFGLAAVLDSGREATQRITRTGQVVGDIHSMSPEQIRGEKVTGRADVYQVGVLAYHMLTGEGPFGNGPPARIMAAHLEEEPRDLTQLRMTIDPALSVLVRPCLAKEARRRPTAADLARRLSEPEGVGAAAGLDPLDLLKRRVPQFVVAAAVVGGAFIGGVHQLDEQGYMFEGGYELSWILVIHGVAAAAVVSWFHGPRGKQRVTPLEVGVLAVLGASWVALSAWTFLTLR